jgi:hypothetical protein
VLALAALSAPAAAASYPNCVGGSPGIEINLGVGSHRTKAEQEVFDKMELRQAGIDADTVERTWLECFKVTRFENGRWVVEYYHPDRLEDGPMQLDRW